MTGIYTSNNSIHIPNVYLLLASITTLYFILKIHSESPNMTAGFISTLYDVHLHTSALPHTALHNTTHTSALAHSAHSIMWDNISISLVSHSLRPAHYSRVFPREREIVVDANLSIYTTALIL